MILEEKYLECSEEKLATLPPFPPQTPYELAWIRTRAFAGRSW
jgi:hypothetical protein